MYIHPFLLIQIQKLLISEIQTIKKKSEANTAKPVLTEPWVNQKPS